MSKVKNAILVTWLIITTIISVAALARSFYHNTAITVDYSGILVGILAALCTVLIGWQIFSLINLRDIEKRFKKIENDRESEAYNMIGIQYEQISTVCSMIAANVKRGNFLSMSLYCDILKAVTLDGERKYKECDEYLESEVLSTDPLTVDVNKGQFISFREALKCFSNPKNLKNYDRLIDWVMRLNVVEKPASQTAVSETGAPTSH